MRGQDWLLLIVAVACVIAAIRQFDRTVWPRDWR